MEQLLSIASALPLINILKLLLGSWMKLECLCLFCEKGNASITYWASKKDWIF